MGILNFLGFVFTVHCVKFIFSVCLFIGFSLIKRLPLFLVNHQQTAQNHEQCQNCGQNYDQSYISASIILVTAGKGQHSSIRQNIAGFARVSRQASALVIVKFVNTKTVMHTGTPGTLVSFLRTDFSAISRWASADKIVNGIVASASVSTRVNAAFVNVNFTVGSVKTG